MQDELYQYQKDGVEWLKTKRFALLADEMGLGKSAQAIVASDSVVMARSGAAPLGDSDASGAAVEANAAASRLLILCPAVARFNWANECEKFSMLGRQPSVLLNSQSLRMLPVGKQLTNLMICSYDLASQNAGFLAALKPDILILDEVHYLKSTEAKRTLSVFGAGGIARHSGRTWALSGTPAPNNAAELWPLLRVFGRTSLEYDAFVSRYCTSRWTRLGVRITGTNRARIPELYKILAPLMLRRRKAEVMKELPAIVYGGVVVEAKSVAGLVPANLAGLCARAEAAVNSGEKNLATLSDSLSTYRRHVGLLKMANAARLVDEELELGLYEKIVIFGHHTAVLEGMRLYLRNRNPVLITGSTLPKAREQAIQRFQYDPECKVFIANIQAAGTAINLTAASNVMMLEPDWVPGNNAQAIARCHRIGQSEPVMVRFVELAGDSLDRKIMAVVSRKTRELTRLFGD